MAVASRPICSGLGVAISPPSPQVGLRCRAARGDAVAACNRSRTAPSWHSESSHSGPAAPAVLDAPSAVPLPGPRSGSRPSVTSVRAVGIYGFLWCQTEFLALGLSLSLGLRPRGWFIHDARRWRWSWSTTGSSSSSSSCTWHACGQPPLWPAALAHAHTSLLRSRAPCGSSVAVWPLPLACGTAPTPASHGETTWAILLGQDRLFHTAPCGEPWIVMARCFPPLDPPRLTFAAGHLSSATMLRIHLSRITLHKLVRLSGNHCTYALSGTSHNRENAGKDLPECLPSQVNY